MKRNKSLAGRGLWKLAAILLAAGVLMGAGLAGDACLLAEAQSAQEAPPYEISAEVGYGGQYNSYRQLPVKVVVTNNHKDFIGTAELLYADGNGEILAYKQELVLAAGESKTLWFSVMPAIEQAFVGTARIVDEDEKVLATTTLNVTGMLATGQMVVGVLSEADTASYFNSTTHSIVTFMPEYITQAEQMEMLDVILVDRFNLDALSSTQIGELERWVELGGTLVLGTGSRYNETLTAFSAEFLSGKVGDLTTLTYTYGNGAAGKEMTEELAYCPLALTDAVSAMTVGEETLLWKVPRGQGSVLVSAIGLELPSWLQVGLGEDIYQAIERNLSDDREKQLRWEQTGGSYTYYLNSALRQGNDADTPNILLYAGVLVVYVLVVGPVLYLVLKKFDKRHYMWGLVPATSLIFTGIIFLLGTPTRIREPYMSYVTILDYSLEDPEETTYFRLTAPYNRSYDVVVEKDYEITSERSYGYYNYAVGTIFDGYDIGFVRDEGGTSIELRDPSAFEAFTFMARGTAESAGSYESELMVQADGTVTGYLTNNLGYDLEYVFLAHAGEVFYVGHVPEGETVTIDSSTLPGQLTTSYYSMDSGFIEREAFGYNYYEDMETTRKYYALAYYLNNNAYQMEEGAFFVGISGAGAEESFTAGSTMRNFGVTVPVLPVTKLAGQKFEASIDNYEVALLEGAYELPWNRYLLADTVTIEYDLYDVDAVIQTGEALPQAIVYSAKYNNELRGENWDYFPGRVYFKNISTGQMDLIFEGGTEGICEDLSPYLTDGHIVISYEVDPDQFYNEQYNIVIPVLSLVREVGDDGTD